MSSLTTEINRASSPVASWMKAAFPNVRQLQAPYRQAAGTTKVLPEGMVSPQTQGTAIDWWLRFLVDSAPSVGLAIKGLMTMLERGYPGCVPAGTELFGSLLSEDSAEYPVLDVERFKLQSDARQARICLALALMSEAYRAVHVDGSRLTELSQQSTVEDLMALAHRDEIDDLIAMRDLAVANLIPQLPKTNIHTGMTFDGSRDLNADADLIADGMLIDFKATIGNSPRKDGTRVASLSANDLYQLIGYALMDYSDTYRLHTVGIYLVRFGHLTTWRLEDLIARLSGGPEVADLFGEEPVGVAERRQQFQTLLGSKTEIKLTFD